MNKGLFVVFDGPNGSGKTFVLQCFQNALLSTRVQIYSTKEPTGRFEASLEDVADNVELFEALLRDREAHINEDIVPALDEGKHVLCDRYIASTLVYQRLDGLPFQYIWKRNREFLIPDLYVFVYTSPETIKERLLSRDGLTRFEKNITPTKEIEYFKEVQQFWENKEFPTFVFHNDKFSLFNESLNQLKSMFFSLLYN